MASVEIGRQVLIGISLVVIVAILWLRPRLRLVNEHEQIAVFRFGRLRKVSGPGLVLLFARLDTVQSFDTRVGAHSCSVEGIIFYGIPIALGLTLWIRVDLLKASTSDNLSTLSRAASLSEQERLDEVNALVQSVLRQNLLDFERRHPLPNEAPTAARVDAIRSYVSSQNEARTRMRRELLPRLWALGVVLSAEHQIEIMDFGLPDNVTEMLRQGEMIASLRQQLPGASDSDLAQVVTMVIERRSGSIEASWRK